MQKNYLKKNENEQTGIIAEYIKNLKEKCKNGITKDGKRMELYVPYDRKLKRINPQM